MKNRNDSKGQGQFLQPDLPSMLDPRQELYRLAQALPWGQLEKEFEGFYSEEGRPAKPIRLMVGLLILKQLHDLSDEELVGHWKQNPYFQFFCGEEVFKWEPPCEPSDLTHFRNRIGPEGIEKILEASIKLHGKRALEEEVVIDTTVQEKNITYPTDSKLAKKIIERCWKIQESEEIAVRRSYKRTVPKLLSGQRYWGHRTKAGKARKSARRLNTIAGTLVRELRRKLPHKALKHYESDLELYEKVLAQRPGQKDRIYSLHETQVYCMAKGKSHKRYEYGAKASVVMSKTSGVIVGALSFSKNIYDHATLDPALAQVEKLSGKRPKICITDKGYRGRARNIGGTDILTPRPSAEGTSDYERRKMRKRFRRRTAIEPIIGHLKSDHRMARNYLKGNAGDDINLMMAAAAFNFRKWMRNLLARLQISLGALLEPQYSITPILQPS